MARPRAKELTERELEVMQAFWDCGESTIADVRDEMTQQGRDLAYTTVATLVRIMTEKGFLTQTNEERPFTYLAARSVEDVTGNMLTDMVERVFQGSREKLLLRLLGQKKLTAKERTMLEEILRENKR
jgi:predicted transcriptional regulator